MYDSRSLVVVQERGAEEDQRRDDKVGDERGNARLSVRLPVQEQQQHHARDEVDDAERAEGSERVHVVRERELSRTDKRRPRADPFDHDDRNGEPEQRKPRERRKHEEAEERGHRRKHDEPEQQRRDECARRPAPRSDEQHGADVRRGQQGRRCPEDQRLGRQRVAGGHLVDRRHRQAECERRPEAVPVEADRLRDHLADGPELRR